MDEESITIPSIQLTMTKTINETKTENKLAWNIQNNQEENLPIFSQVKTAKHHFLIEENAKSRKHATIVFDCKVCARQIIMG